MAFSWVWDSDIEGWIKDPTSTDAGGTVTWDGANGSPDPGCMLIEQSGSYSPPFAIPYTEAEVTITPAGVIGAGGAQVQLDFKCTATGVSFGVAVYATLRVAGKIFLGNHAYSTVWHTAFFGIDAGYAGDIIDNLHIRIQAGITRSGTQDLRIDTTSITGVTPEPSGGPGEYEPGYVVNGVGGGNMDIDPAGAYLYIGAIDNSGFPVVIKQSAALDADGTLEYEPGAGDSVEIVCARQNAELVYANGNFGVPKLIMSDDAGATWSTIDDAWAGVTTVRPIEVIASADDILAAMTDDQQDAYRTLDVGVAWELLNNALPIVVGAFDLLDVNPNESIIGVKAAGVLRVLYSQDSFANFTDLTLGTPNNDVTKVIVG